MLNSDDLVPDDGGILRIEDITRLLGVNRTTVWRWIHAGAFPPGRSLSDGGRAICWHASELNAWWRQRGMRSESNAATRSKATVPARRARSRMAADERAGVTRWRMGADRQWEADDGG
jgi:excisionase family DNA binding protein